MTGYIECYFDIVSLFSYSAFVELSSNIDVLRNLGIQISFHPVSVKKVQALSGNTPPWKTPAKARYLARDSIRSTHRVGILSASFLSNYFELSDTDSHLLVLRYIKDYYSPSTFLYIVRSFFEKFWTPPHSDLTRDNVLVEIITEAAKPSDTMAKLLNRAEVQRIITEKETMRSLLEKDTLKVTETGAFGMPWFEVKNRTGEVETFFGSDRFNHIYEFLGIPFQDIKVIEPKMK